MQRSAVVYSVNDRLIVGASRRTPAGFHIEVEPRPVSSDIEPSEFAGFLSAALDMSAVPAIAPKDWKGAFDPFLRAAAVRSLKDFMAQARSVNIDEIDGRFEITPNQNLGSKEGFEPASSEKSIASDLESAARAVLNGLSL
jgi:hypothetical protein